MKSTLKKNKGSVVEGEITLTTDEFKPHWEAIYGAALSRVQVPGFRAGSAPRELAMKHVDTDAVFHEAANRAVRESLSHVTEENDWKIIDGPSVEVLEASPLEKASDAKPGFRYKARFVVFPEVKLGNYKKIAHKIFKEQKAVVVSPEEIEQSIEWLRGSRAEMTKVDRPAAKGDVVEADVESFLDNEPIPGGKLVHDRFLLGESRFVPGFDDMLVGSAIGARLDFSLTAPADYWNESLRGREIRFAVILHAVFERKLPELNDAFAASLGSEIKTIEGLKKNIREGLEHEKQDREQDRIRAKMIEAIATDSEIDVPDVMLERTLEALVEETAELTKQDAGAPDKTKLREALREKAVSRVKGYLVMHAIAEEAALTPTEEEVREEMARRGVDQKDGYDYSYGILRNKKVFEFLEKQ